MSPLDIAALAEPERRVDTNEDSIINELADKIIRREKPTQRVAGPAEGPDIGASLRSFTERLERVESIAMRTQHRLLVAVAVIATLIVLLSVVGVYVTRRERGPTLQEMDGVFNRNLKQPIEKLERVIDRLDRRLEATTP